MKIKGSFVMRQVVGEYILVPVEDTALEFNGMISLNPVSAFIWQQLEQGRTQEQILGAVLEEFDVDRDTAKRDLQEFLQQLRDKNFLE